MILLYKKPGFTPLQAIEEYKQTHPEYQSTTLSYAGRLDPMAEGLLLILEGEENKQRHDYEKLSKIYEFEMLVGYSTDSYDVMGLITRKDIQPINLSELDTILQHFHGKQTLPLPAYSSKPVNSKPLYWYAKRNLMHTITVPTQDITIHSLSRISTNVLSSQQIIKSITNRLTIVRGDFRQQEIHTQWQQELNDNPTNFTVIKCTLEATHGTYVRGIVHSISMKTDVPMLTYSLKRLKIGEYNIDSIKTL
jgi:tRNA pseudouridine(55) synthase